MPIRVAIQQSQRFLRDGLTMLLAAEPDVEVVGAVSAARDLTELCAAARPDVVVLDLDAQGWDACRLAAALRSRHRAVRVVGLHQGARFAQPARAFQAGVRATVGHAAGSSALLAAVRGSTTARSGVVPLAPAALVAPTQVLTAREVEVLERIAEGCTTKEIASQLGIAAKTVENHKQRIFAKLGVQNQAHAVAVALRRGLVSAHLRQA